MSSELSLDNPPFYLYVLRMYDEPTLLFINILNLKFISTVTIINFKMLTFEEVSYK